LPVIISYGQAQDTIAIALGYGRSKGVGPAAFGSGQNAYPFLKYENGTVVLFMHGSVAYETLAGTHQIGMSQRYHTLTRG
jgi:hypothetical protein